MTKKIGIATRGGLGDCLMMTPAIKSIKNKYPECLLGVYCITDGHYQVLLNNPYVDILIEPGEKGIEKMKSEFSVVEYFNNADIFPSINGFLEPSSKYFCDFFKVPFEMDDLDMFLTDQEIQEGKSIVSKFRFPVIINPTSVCSKNEEWYIERWEELICRFPEVDFIQIGLLNEQYIKGAHDFRGQYSLRFCISIINSSRAYIGVDSFFGHVASALNVLGIILFGDSSPFVYGHFNNINIYKAEHCSPCFEMLGGERCPYNKKCMDKITVDDVSEELHKIINYDKSRVFF